MPLVSTYIRARWFRASSRLHPYFLLCRRLLSTRRPTTRGRILKVQFTPFSSFVVVYFIARRRGCVVPAEFREAVLCYASIIILVSLPNYAHYCKSLLHRSHIGNPGRRTCCPGRCYIYIHPATDFRFLCGPLCFGARANSIGV